MIGYAVETAIKACGLQGVYVNTDSDRIANYAASLGCSVYRRPEHLGSDTATGDDFTIDFIEALKMDTLVMISPVCPLLTPVDVEDALKAYADSDADTLISCSDTQMQAFMEGNAVNIKPQGPLAPSQQNPRIQICNWAITIWNTAKFRELYAKFKGGYCGEKRILWPLEPLKSVKISEEKDFRIAEALLLSRRAEPESSSPAFWSPDGP
jgi:CMP-N-acetylneuraminic acid synthetase